MKKIVTAVITSIAVLITLTATAERKIWMYSSDGNHVSLDVSKLAGVYIISVNGKQYKIRVD